VFLGRVVSNTEAIVWSPGLDGQKSSTDPNELEPPVQTQGLCHGIDQSQTYENDHLQKRGMVR
jgi:hypothetical protein